MVVNPHRLYLAKADAYKYLACKSCAALHIYVHSAHVNYCSKFTYSIADDVTASDHRWSYKRKGKLGRQQELARYAIWLIVGLELQVNRALAQLMMQGRARKQPRPKGAPLWFSAAGQLPAR